MYINKFMYWNAKLTDVLMTQKFKYEETSQERFDCNKIDLPLSDLKIIYLNLNMNSMFEK